MSEQLNNLISTVKTGSTNLKNIINEEDILNCEDYHKVILISFGGLSYGDFQSEHQGLLIETYDGLKYFDRYGTRESSDQSLRDIDILNIFKGLRWDILVPEKYGNYDEWSHENISFLTIFTDIEKLSIEEISTICVNRMIY